MKFSSKNGDIIITNGKKCGNKCKQKDIWIHMLDTLDSMVKCNLFHTSLSFVSRYDDATYRCDDCLNAKLVKVKR